MNKWWIILAIAAVLSMDFWNWNKSEPFISFLPFWAWQIFVISIFLSLFLALFAKYQWREKDD